MSAPAHRLLAVTFALASLGAGSPAERYCASLGQGSRLARAESALEFYRHITTDTVFPTSAACLADHIEEIHQKAAAYCALRDERGHDAIAELLSDLEFELMLKSSDCLIELSSELSALLSPPISCESLRDAVGLIHSLNVTVSESTALPEDEPTVLSATCAARATARMEAAVDTYCAKRAVVDDAFASSVIERGSAECEKLADELAAEADQPPAPE